MTCKIVVLISGSGSNLQALIDSTTNSPNAQIVKVVSNRADAYGLVRADNAGIAHASLDHKQFDSREAFDAALIQEIDQAAPNLVVLAGFMRILTPSFVRHYQGRLLNIHPSLLPKHKGLHTHRRALEEGDQEHGCSVHFVSEELDGGPVILQALLSVDSGDNEDSLAQRVHALEHQIYPLAVQWFAEGRLRQTQEGAILDGKRLPACGEKIRSI